MPIPLLMGVKLPQISKISLKNEIKNLKEGSKTSLYFFYSEFLLRANRNPSYKEVLNRANITAIDGKGLHWAMWRTMKIGFLPTIYSQFIINWPIVARLPIFLIFFVLELIINLFSGLFSLMLKINFTARTRNQTILGRDLVYDLFKIAEEKKWKTVILGGNSSSDEVTKNLVSKLFPDINLVTWTRDTKSNLMKDIQPVVTKRPASNLVDRLLSLISNQKVLVTTNNLFQVFPDLFEAKEFIRKEKPDLILTCFGGGSGKQEFFIDNLCNDKEISFTLATGIGAAVDHLGGGAKQTESPKFLQSIGLEWLFRFYNQPYRRVRIIDSIVTLWFWTTLQEFMQKGEARETVHAAIHRSFSIQNQVNISATSPFLLVERYNILPSDTGWSMVQGEIEKGEELAFAALREATEETNLAYSDLIPIGKPVEVGVEMSSLSLIRFILWGAKYNRTINYVQLVQYIGSDLHPKTNWENQRAKWWPVSDISSVLSADKRILWEKFIWQKMHEDR